MSSKTEEPQEARQQELLGVLRDTLRYMRGHDYFLDAEELRNDDAASATDEGD